jgi:hypothetical protein
VVAGGEAEAVWASAELDGTVAMNRNKTKNRWLENGISETLSRKDFLDAATSY